MAPDEPQTAAETLEEAGAASEKATAVRPHLFLVVEGDRPCGGGARWGLTGVSEVTIGRGTARTAQRQRSGDGVRLAVQVPGKWMSTSHARLVRTRGTWVAEDAGSRNGTYVNGERITRRTLADGDVLEAGHTLFVFRDALPTPAGVPEDVDSTAMMGLPPGLRTLLPSLSPGLEKLARVAPTDVPLVLLGETGTGKEVVARAAHELSGRRGAFVAVNCGSLSPALVEGLLFGHVKGSFSGATRDEPGFVRAADGGTLFLDEIGDFPAAAQPALLRVLQEREVVPVGASRPVPVDFRVVAATHRDLDVLVAESTFRRDLLMRLDGFRHTLPGLRDRREDLGLLFVDLIPRRAGPRAASVTFTTEALRAILDWDWPGNVRELEQALGRSLALAHDEPIGVDHLGLRGQPERGGGGGGEKAESLSESDARLRDEVVAALTAHEGNVAEVARVMGKARMQVQRWMRRFGLDPEEYRRSK